MRKGVLTFKQLGRYGRLCNQMFEIASTIGLATKYNYYHAFPYWKNYDAIERFNTTENIDLQSYFVNPLPLIDESVQYQDLNVDWGYNPPNKLFEAGNYNIIGHMQSEKYFLHCKDLIHHYFEQKPIEIKEPIPKDAVCVHVRLGDYDGSYHPRLGLDYYMRALNLLPKHSEVWVFSDDPDKCAEMFADMSHFKIIYDNDTMRSFYTMRQFTYYVIGNSSFSWWAAWLSKAENKQVVAPLNWFGAVAGIGSEDIYCDGWITV